MERSARVVLSYHDDVSYTGTRLCDDFTVSESEADHFIYITLRIDQRVILCKYSSSSCFYYHLYIRMNNAWVTTGGRAFVPGKLVAFWRLGHSFFTLICIMIYF